jgi:hypothetical protein
MRLYIDLDTRGFIESESFPRSVQSLSFKRRDFIPIELSFLRNGIIQELSESATGKIGLKHKGQFGSPFYLAFDGGWIKTGSGDSTRYKFSLNLHTTEIESAFLAEPTSVPAMIEIEWRENQLVTSSLTIDVDLQNDVNRGDEGVAQDATPIYPLPSEIVTRAPVDANFRFKDGTHFQVFNETTGKWHTLFLTGADGATQLAWSETGEL